MSREQALAFVREHGVVLVSAGGPAPKLTEAIAGETIRGSWWGHPKGKQIFAVLDYVCAQDEVLMCRLVGDKVTLVHRRLWPALAAAAGHFPPSRVCRLTQEHMPDGRHRNRETAFPDWLPPDATAAAAAMHSADALAALGTWAGPGRHLLPIVTEPLKAGN